MKMEPKITRLESEALRALDVPDASCGRLREIEDMYFDCLGTMHRVYGAYEKLDALDVEAKVAKGKVLNMVYGLSRLERALADEHDLLQRPHEYYWTTAPRDYDGFGTTDLWFEPEGKPTEEHRAVLILERHAHWQRMRYASGLHHYVTVDEAKEQQAR